MRAQPAWVVHSRPDIACAVSMAQATEKTFGHESIKLVNKIIKHLQNTISIRMKYPKLDPISLHLTVYSDDSFNSNNDNSSQLGYIIVLMDKHHRGSILHFSSHKSRRVTRSSIAAENLAFVDGFGNAFILRHDLQRMLGRKILLLMLTDSKALFDVITGSDYTTEKRLMVDLAAIREAYNDRTISIIGLIRSEHNPAAGLTKTGPNAAWQKLLQTNKLQHPIEQYVIDI